MSPKKGRNTDSATQAPDQQADPATNEQETNPVSTLDAIEAPADIETPVEAPADGETPAETPEPEGEQPADGTDATGEPEGDKPTGETVDQAVEAVLNPMQAQAVQALEWIRDGANGEPPFSADAMELVIAWAKTPVAKAGRTAASTVHDDTCATLAKHDLTREERETELRAQFDALPDMWKTDAVLKAQLDTIAAEYDCNCSLSKRTASGRQAPSRTGKAGAVVTGPDGSVYVVDSLNLAARKALELYPGAKQCAAYVKRTNKVSDGGDGKTANARVFIQSDLKAGRLPAGSVTFNDAADEGAADEAPADAQAEGAAVSE